MNQFEAIDDYISERDDGHMVFDEIYEAHADRVYAYLAFRIKDKYMVEDIFQETFLAVYDQCSRSMKVDSVKAWILKIAHHKMVDRLRQTKREVASDDMETHIILEGREDPMTNKIFAEELLQRLDETSRSLMYGIYVEKMTYKEMSDILGIPEGTAKSKCHYAKNKLLGWLKEGSI